MMNNEFQNAVAEMMHDWNALPPAQQRRASLIANIAASEIELEHRLIAAPKLSGIPQLQNASAINTLYDALVNLNIELIELEATS